MKLTKRGRIVLIYIPLTALWLYLALVAFSLPGQP